MVEEGEMTYNHWLAKM